MKNIFLDCGTNICQGLTYFYNNGIIDDTYEIHTFEPNSIGCRVKERIEKIKEQIPLNIIIYDSAVWIEDGFVSFKTLLIRSGNTCDNISFTFPEVISCSDIDSSSPMPTQLKGLIIE